MIKYKLLKNGGDEMDKNKILESESGNLENVIRNLIKIDSEVTKFKENALSERKKILNELPEKKKAIKEQYKAKADTHIEDIKHQIAANSEKTLVEAKINCEKRIKKLDALAAEKSEAWIEDIFNRTILN